MLCAEVSIYPLKTTDNSGVINSSIEALNKNPVEYSVGSISTHLHGDETQVWKGLQDMFNDAQRKGEVSMVVTLTNAAD